MPTYRNSATVILFVLLVCPGECLCQGWKWSTRLDASLVQDNNVFESIADPRSDVAGRLLADITGDGRLTPSVMFSFKYKGGLEAYTHHAEENRMIHDLLVRGAYGVHPRISLGLAVQGRSKTFFGAERGYAFYNGSPFIRHALSDRLRGSVFFVLSRLDYTEGQLFDYTQKGWGVGLEWTVTPRINWGIQYTRGTLDFSRQALDYEDIEETIFQWIDLGFRQKDHLQEVSTSLEIYFWALMRLGISYQDNASNSYGFSYRRPKIELLVAKSFPWSLTLRFYWTLLFKDYSDPLQPILQIFPDSENEENSFTLIDLSKDLKHAFSLRCRIGWYRNESPFRDLYYEKTILSCGIARRF